MSWEGGGERWDEKRRPYEAMTTSSSARWWWIGRDDRRLDEIVPIGMMGRYPSIGDIATTDRYRRGGATPTTPRCNYGAPSVAMGRKWAHQGRYTACITEMRTYRRLPMKSFATERRRMPKKT
jgi:hypothetical protein